MLERLIGYLFQQPSGTLVFKYPEVRAANTDSKSGSHKAKLPFRSTGFQLYCVCLCKYRIAYKMRREPVQEGAHFFVRQWQLPNASCINSSNSVLLTCIPAFRFAVILIIFTVQKLECFVATGKHRESIRDASTELQEA